MLPGQRLYHQQARGSYTGQPPTVADDADPVCLDEGFEYGDAATTSRKSLAARRASMPANGGRRHLKAPRQRNAAPEYIVVSKQLLESKPTVPTVKRAPLRTSGDSFADDDLTPSVAPSRTTRGKAAGH